jgi:hypothetical protein
LGAHERDWSLDPCCGEAFHRTADLDGNGNPRDDILRMVGKHARRR